MAMICRRRAMRSASSCVASSANGRGSGAVASAKWAITAASIGSVPRLRGDKLGPNAERPGESPDLRRIDNDDRKSGRAKRCRHDSFEAAGGLQGDQFDIPSLELGDEVIDAGCRAVNSKASAARPDGDIQPVLRNINANNDL